MRAILTCCAALLIGTAAWAQTPINESAAAAKDGTVRIKNVSGSVNVVAWDKEEVAVTGTLGEGSERLEFVPGGADTLIRVVIPRSARNVEGTHLNVSVPATSRVDVETVSAEIELKDVAGEVSAQSVSGDIVLRGSMPRVDAETVSGEITVESTDVAVEAESVSGSLGVTADAGAVDLETVSGDARVDVKALRKVSFESVSGSIYIVGGLVPDAQVEVETHSGDIDCALPSDTSARVVYHSFSGKFDARDFGVSGKKSGELLLGSGTGRIDLDTFSGDARVRRTTGETSGASVQNIEVGGEVRVRAGVRR